MTFPRQSIAWFFKHNFNLTGREGAALMLGSHSLGTFNFEISQFKYDWTRQQNTMLNNQVARWAEAGSVHVSCCTLCCRHVAMRPQYFYECRDSAPYVGDYLGQPAVTRWVVRAHGCAEGMGPFQWFHQYYR